MAAANAALRLTITAAGRAALRNAQGNGTNKVLVATAGLTSTAFTPGDPVPAEIKRVATIAGGATAADTIHVTISDTSGDAFPILGFGLYLDDGVTLLASYGQATAIVEKSAQAAALIAVDIQFADVDATQITFGDTNFNNPAATTEVLGVVELATDDETVTGTDPVRAVTPKSLLAAINDRLGKGAPSVFVKPLLTAVSATAFRLALGIKSAGTFDTGAGNKLDADLLDGQEGTYYLAWGNLTGVPGVFPPSSHQHAASDITSGVFPVARGGTGLGAVPAGNYLMGGANGTDPLVPRTPDQVLSDIGAAAKSHSHTIANVTGLQAALDGKSNVGHGHAISDVANLQSSLDAKANLAGASFTGVISNRGMMASAFAGLNPGQLQGAYFGWNQDGTGKTELWNNQGTGQGGWRFVNMTSATAATVAVTIDGVGNISGNSISLAAGVTTKTVSVNVGALGSGQFSQNYAMTLSGTSSNGDILYTGLYRGTAGTSWTTAAWRMQRRVDATLMEFLQFGAGDGSGGNRITLGAGNQTLDLTGSGMTVSTSITAAGGFQYSDRRLKEEIKREAVHRGIALKMARAFRSWRMKGSGVFDKGLLAQWVQKHIGHYVSVGTDKRKLLGVDKSGLALEGVMDNALSIYELEKRIKKLERRK